MRMQLFTVESQKGYSFPLDMLRYDECFPYNQEDVDKIHKTNNPEGFICPNRIKLKGYVRNKSDKPTEDRWLSFGWKVIEV
ncbi:MAG: hypothetical protein AABY22_02585, partial [Nanoarchaeota archaeon]